MQIKELYLTLIPESVRYLIWVAKAAALNPWFYAILACVFAAEKMIPANRNQKTFSKGLWQDFLWFQTDNLLQLVWIPVYLGFLKMVYDRYLAFLTVHAVGEWPEGVRFVAAFVITDFFAWLHHYIRHKVKYFWFFHTIHHSQKEVNVFTEGRFHMVEPVIAWFIRFIPVFMLDLSGVSIVAVAFIHRWYTRIYHANLKTNYGFLKYFMVTPQSHRIHHSSRPEHRDKNFGVIFSVWDRLFGTQYKNYEEYPETGIEDVSFPAEQKAKGLGFIGVYFQQILYPFRLLYQEMADKFSTPVKVGDEKCAA